MEKELVNRNWEDMLAITISGKEPVSLKKPEVWVYGGFGEEREETNDILAL